MPVLHPVFPAKIQKKQKKGKKGLLKGIFGMQTISGATLQAVQWIQKKK